MSLKALLLSAVWMATVASASAQAIPSEAGDLGPTVSKNYPIVLSFNYTAMIGNAPPGQCGCFLLNGGSSEELFYIWKNVAAVAQVAGNRAQNIPQSQQGLSLVTYMAGPRYSFRTSRRLTACSRTSSPTGSPTAPSANSRKASGHARCSRAR